MKRKTIQKLLACLLAVAMSVGLLAGCGSSSSSEDTSEDTTEDTTEESGSEDEGEDASADQSADSEDEESETEEAQEESEEEPEEESTTAGISEDGVTYYSLVDSADAVGYEASYDADSGEADVSNDVYTVSIDTESSKAQISYKEDEVDVDVIVDGDTVYVPETFLSDYLDIVYAPEVDDEGEEIEGGDLVASLDPNAIYRNAIRANAYDVKESYDFERTDTMLEMDDGVKLETIIYQPAGDGAWPTAFSRGPYPVFEGMYSAIGEEYAKRGMAYVYQYCRGKGNSEGVYVANDDERADGITSLNWLNDQDWVESIGVHGHSYLGLTAWLVGDVLPEKVGAMHIQSYGVLRNLSVSHSGLVAVDNITAWTMQNCTDVYDYDYYLESAQYLPQVDVDTDLWGEEVDGYADWVDHPNFNDEYWNEGVWGDLKNAISQINVPTTIFGGYYDHHYEGTVEAWNMLNDETKAMSHMVLGCWNHVFEYVADWKGGSNYTYDKDTDTFNWFYSILVNDTVPETGIDAYVVGEDEWLHMDSFPVESDEEMTFYLTADETDSDGTATALSTESPESTDTFTYVYDPSDPRITEGGECLLTTEDLRGSNELSPAGYRDDVISFITDPFEEDTILGGDLIADLFVSTDAEDTCFTYTISEVDENGTAHNIRNGLMTLAYRNSRYEDAVYDYVPGEVVELEIESLPIIWEISAGDRIRIDISSSDFPEFSVHTNTAGNWAEQTDYVVANQTLYVGGDYASYITLPVIKNE